MNEQTGIFLTNEEVLYLADTLHDYTISTNRSWALGEETAIDKVFGRAVKIKIKNNKEKTK